MLKSYKPKKYVNKNVTNTLYLEMKEDIKQFREDNYKNKPLQNKITTKTQQLISKLSLKMLTDFPFLFGIIRRVDRRVDYNLDAPMSVSFEDYKIYLNMNPLLIEKYCEDDLTVYGVLLHETLHLLYKHLLRYKDSFPKGHGKMVNYATDCQINQEIQKISKESFSGKSIQHALSLPKNGVGLDTIENIVGYSLEKDKTSEYYYSVLLKEKEKQSKNNDFDKKMSKEHSKLLGNNENNIENEDGQLTDSDGNPVNDNLNISNQKGISENNAEIDKNKQVSEPIANTLVDNVIKKSYEELTDSQRGAVRSKYNGIISNLYKKPMLNWKSIVRKDIGNIFSHLDSNRRRLNRRQPNRLDLSGSRRVKINPIYIFIDVSGSISDNVIAYIIAEILNIMKSFNINLPVVIVQISTEVISEEVIKNEKELREVKRKDNGGTLFQPAFDYLKENNLKNSNSYSVYFTDGYGEKEVNTYGYNMRWVNTNKNRNTTKISCVKNSDKVPNLFNDEKANALLNN